MIVDAHHHLWRIGHHGHEWPTPDLKTIHRDFELSELEKLVTDINVKATILVQSQPSHLDTEWLLDMALDTERVKGVVGWADLAAPHAPACVRALARRSKLCGLRPMLQAMPEDDWILRHDVRPALVAMADEGLSFDALVFTRHLPSIVTLGKAFPSLNIVIDHGAKPPLAQPEHLPAWRDRISQAAESPNIFCKLSGLFTELAPGQDRNEVRPVADHLLSVFGQEGLMWGSDWPVVNLAGDYHAWLAWVFDWLGERPLGVRDAVLAQTARAFYRL